MLSPYSRMPRGASIWLASATSERMNRVVTTCDAGGIVKARMTGSSKFVLSDFE